MTIKIKETIERDCCEPRDLKKCQGGAAQVFKVKGYGEIYSCQHCGQLWENEKYTDAAGSIDTRLKPLKL